jgi:hypothetical protein
VDHESLSPPTVLAWHFLRENRRLGFGDGRIVESGKTFQVEPPIELCERGLHASVRAIDAIEYAPGPIVCRVLLSGEILHGDDKAVATHRTVLWVADADAVLHEFACVIAERALDAAVAGRREADPRSRNAIRVKRSWAAGNATYDELVAARDAAWGAAWSRAAALAAASCAWGAAWVSARDAARAAAKALAWVDVRDDQNRILEHMLLGLAPKAAPTESP